MVKGMKLAPEFLLKLLVGVLPVEKHAARKTVPYEVAQIGRARGDERVSALRQDGEDSQIICSSESKND